LSATRPHPASLCHANSSVTIAQDNLTLSSRGKLRILRDLLLSTITSDLGLRLLAPLRPRCATLLYLHRFAVPELGVSGHDPAVLSQLLEYLRRRRYRLMSVMDLLNHLDEGIPLKESSVVFTVDDGYSDFAGAGAPVFAAYDCPVTVFLVTDFVSGRLWNWFDRVAWAFAHTDHGEVTLEIHGERVRLRWTNSAERKRAGNDMVERLKRVADSAKNELIVRVEQILEVEIPTRAPEKYRAMDWDQIRTCASRGVTFGPHTVSHPILSQVDSVRAEREITGSWDAIVAGTEAAVPVFCYPNGTAADFTRRDEELVAIAGMTAGVSTIDGSLESSTTGIAPVDRFAIPRHAYSEDKRTFVQIVSGLEATKARLRGHSG
jgi:peptidoglycan/xylan/chitin deacetylase (PgdA/CDA1 family)